MAGDVVEGRIRGFGGQSQVETVETESVMLGIVSSAIYKQLLSNTSRLSWLSV